MQKRKQIIWSAVIAIGFLIISYCLTNLDLPLSGEKALLYKFELYRNMTTYKESSFVKYPYLTDSIASMPLRMYEDITGRTVSRHGLLYTDGWKVVRKSVTLAFDVNVNTAYNENGEKNWYNLHAILFSSLSREASR